MPFLNLGDAELYYETAGSGPALLLNPATAWHGETWKLYQVPEFAKDHTVITYDPRGTGKTKTTSEDFSTQRLTEDAAALLEHLKVKNAIVLGHSNGGRIAISLAADFPHLVGKLILASSGTTYNGPPGIPFKMCVELVKMGYEPYMRKGVFDVGFTKAYYEANKAICDKFIDVRLSNLLPIENFLRYVVNRQASDVAAKVKHINVPTLVMVGDDEHHHATGLTHFQAAEQLSKNIAGAKLVVLPGQGHHYLFVAPEAANKIIRSFLV